MRKGCWVRILISMSAGFVVKDAAEYSTPPSKPRSIVCILCVATMAIKRS
ncbi:MAG: hypothetical protein Q4B85_13355 [Lachnospiraceae bacterium]|nr:hypothetical protein [Lachnospiraceae bacterium]